MQINIAEEDDCAGDSDELLVVGEELLQDDEATFHPIGELVRRRMPATNLEIFLTESETTTIRNIDSVGIAESCRTLNPVLVADDAAARMILLDFIPRNSQVFDYFVARVGIIQAEGLK